MIHEADEDTLREKLNNMITKKEYARLKSVEKNRDKEYGDFKIYDEYFQTIKIQLRALGLIKRNEKQRSVKDNKTYWTLTPYGDEIMMRLRAVTSKYKGDLFS
jgi:hypothetical protein